MNWFKKDDIGEPPWEYDFLYNLPKSEYPKYLAKIFNYRTGEKLPLKWDFKTKAFVIDKKRCKTFNQKIQWIKLYGVTDLMRDCTDKVKVRDYVKEKIGEEYLKPVLQIIPNESNETVRCHCEQVNDNLGLARQSTDGSHDILDCRADNKMSLSARNDGELEDVSTYFDKINFDKLPSAFVIKCNHGCKWQYIIKNKEEFIKNKRLFDIVKKNITGWLEQEYWVWNGFEMHYRNIIPKILIEPLMRNEINAPCEEIQIFCFNGKPKYCIKKYSQIHSVSIYDENINLANDIFKIPENKINKKADENIIKAFKLSELLSKEFYFVRIDWMIFQNKLYFGELTFTPHSGFYVLNNNLELGKLINL